MPATSSPDHLSLIGGGKTYSQSPALSLANPGKAKLVSAVQAVFQGRTPRGLLLNAYGFWQIGQIALIASIVAFCAAVIMLILSLPEFWHLSHTTPQAELLGSEPGT